MQSMTGYGKQVLQLPTKKITIEVRTLNSRGIDIRVRIPSIYREMEMDLRKITAEKLQRGKIDVNILLEHTGGETPTKINKPVIKTYLKELSSIYDNPNSDLLRIAMNLPDAILSDVHEIGEEEADAIKNALIATLNEVEAFRLQEGEAMEKDLRIRVEQISDALEQIEAIDEERMLRLRERLLKSVAELKESVDENRFEQELMFYIERYDITEEKVRLKNHLSYFDKTLDSGESNGKKLGFICQEIGREINTIGSKANDSDMQKLVIQMKDGLEKIKEQALNIV